MVAVGARATDVFVVVGVVVCFVVGVVLFTLTADTFRVAEELARGLLVVSEDLAAVVVDVLALVDSFFDVVAAGEAIATLAFFVVTVVLVVVVDFLTEEVAETFLVVSEDFLDMVVVFLTVVLLLDLATADDVATWG